MMIQCAKLSYCTDKSIIILQTLGTLKYIRTRTRAAKKASEARI